MKRSIGLLSVGNARELGGLPAGDTTVCHGVLLRTGGLATASKEDLARLQEVYDVARVIDFRMSYEREQNPDPDVPGAQNIFLPVLEIQDAPGFDPSMLYQLPQLMADRQSMLRLAIQMGMLSPTLYQNFVLSERGRMAYRQFFQTLLELPEGKAVLWHCKDGKDRTGIAAMLLLMALGASRQTIMEDYLLTNVYNASAIAEARAMLEHAPMDDHTKRQMLFVMGSVFEEYLQAAWDAIDDAYGSVDAYLIEALGVGEAERVVLKDKFLSCLTL